MIISDKVLEEFKSEMNIYFKHKDNHLRNILERSYLFVKRKCGSFSLEEQNQGKELTFNRARYEYNDSLEFFDKNFQSMMIDFALVNLPPAGSTAEETADDTTTDEGGDR